MRLCLYPSLPDISTTLHTDLESLLTITNTVFESITDSKTGWTLAKRWVESGVELAGCFAADGLEAITLGKGVLLLGGGEVNRVLRDWQCSLLAHIGFWCLSRRTCTLLGFVLGWLITMNGSRQSLLLSTGGVCVLRIARKAALSSQEKEWLGCLLLLF